MNIQLENTGELTASITVFIPETDYKENVNKLLKDYQKKANIPGFRPGNVPFGMINRMYGKAVVAEEVNKIASEALTNYLKDNAIDILGHPVANTEKSPAINWDEQKDFTFVFDLGIAPSMNIAFGKEIEVPYYHINITDSDLDKQVQDICNQNGTQTESEVVADNDIITAHFAETDKDGNDVENGIAHSSAFITSRIKDNSIKEKIIGLKKGEKIIVEIKKAFEEFELTYILGVEKNKIETLPVYFSLTPETIKHNQPAELNTELFGKIFATDTPQTEEQFRERVKQDMSSQLVNESEGKFLHDVKDVLLEKTQLPLPDAFLQQWLLEINEGKITQEQLEQQYPSYAESLRWQLIENKILKGNSIEVTQEDMREYVKAIFKRTDTEETPEQLQALDRIADSILENEEQSKRINDKIYDEKMNIFFKENFTVLIKEISYSDFYEMVINHHH
ncbi:MAG: trigger factor [Lentimicrobiaceae bacterium]|nr:trigger factor [Lentimicrobiaceae bacterium]